ncbi:tRNA (guanosine(18)-2'-O)-methyltransferase TrmH [Methylonatrum kenyense]|uniref:tRNA (guanosine(18)-2'-O)-methyltransferase TrmH n=1 Tax=Methylonatrum kenyense TaxID=455253 RepID=UPI0020C07960|nr:tRNA (guanosine(18)-2'-O)-methyltransferase TrmH [Methylonatrum kenyense]MCK8516091.1 tRNA (guanosine(18)-2'-O)-methyltransferase TrmH [Methylonatrum kenyense]
MRVASQLREGGMVSRERLCRMQAVLDHRQPDMTVIMAGVHKEHNVSAVLRTADAVGVLEVHGFGTQSVPALKRTAHAGVGQRVRLHHNPRIADGCRSLRQAGLRIVATALAPGARDFRELDYTRPFALMLGAELEGVPDEGLAQADEVVTIPMLGLTDSLNVSVAAAVILYEAQRQRLQAGLFDCRRLDSATCERLLFEWLHPRMARLCLRRGYSYPALDADGDLLHAPGQPAPQE